AGKIEEVASFIVEVSPENFRYYIPIGEHLVKPFVGQLFPTVDDGHLFYTNYANQCGFGVRKGTDTKSRIAKISTDEKTITNEKIQTQHTCLIVSIHIIYQLSFLLQGIRMSDSKNNVIEITHSNVKYSAESSTNQKKIVYVWDMDETLILLKSLLNGTYAEASNGVKDVQKGIEIGKMWEKYILDVCDKHFFYEQASEVENYNQPFCHALKNHDDGQDLSEYDFNQDGIGPPSNDDDKRKLAYRLRTIVHKYKQGLHAILDEKTTTSCNDLYDLTDNYTDGWLSSGRTVLQDCSGQSSPSSPPQSGSEEVLRYNVLVTSGSLIPSLVKCLLFKLDSFFTPENVYSSWDVGKLKCFAWIKDRFPGPNVQFCAIGDGWEESEAAEILRWPLVKIEPKPNGFHKFPGLTFSTLCHYLAVVYGSLDTKQEDEFSLESSSSQPTLFKHKQENKWKLPSQNNPQFCNSALLLWASSFMEEL
ncbi:hypothetical protein V2J09_004751, partial [Rumex salicifolius]